ncbi:MAG TPA: AbrB/MazE/SpoVT family DNA-binding domain-containing protein [Thermoplasmata archaeon]|jgi:AbrB family looped-hinge helix DNA binding protein
MAAVVAIDRAGRIVIPKETRDAQSIRPGTRFLLVEGRKGEIWLQRLDPEELARRVRHELKGVDLDPIIERVEAEIERLAAERYPTSTRDRR